MKNKLLLIGPLTNKQSPEQTGGAIVLFNNLLEQLNSQNVQYELIDTNKNNYKNMFFAYITIFICILKKQFKVTHISLHSSQDYLYLMPYIIFISKTFNKTTSLRKFGGEAYNTYLNSRGLKKILINFIFKNVNYLFLEMKQLVNEFKKINASTYWFPNVRNSHNICRKNSLFRKKFVFISHVKKEKGIDEIIEVKKLLDDSYTIDIYGPISDSKYSSDFFFKHNISYKGPIEAKNVLCTLANYDVLLLPSYKEGYPGIVIESYSVGLPIISTNLKGLEEITDQYKTGILINPKNIEELKNAILFFNKENYNEMSKYSKEKFSLFDSEKQTKLFLSEIIGEESD